MTERPTKALADYGLEIFRHYSTNRGAIESRWQMKTDAFHRVANGYWAPAQAKAAPVLRSDGKVPPNWRSDHFVNITKQKIVALGSIILDAMRPTGKMPFAVDVDNQAIDPEERKLWEPAIDEAESAMHLAHKLTREPRELDRLTMGGLIYGEGWGRRAVIDVDEPAYELSPLDGIEDQAGMGIDAQRWERVQNKRRLPATRYVSCWDMYWDVEVQDIDDAAMLIQRSHVCAYDLRRMKGLAGADDAAIDRVIARYEREMEGRAGSVGTPEGSTAQMQPRLRNVSHRRRGIQHLECWGLVPRGKVAEYLAERDPATAKNPNDVQIDVADGENAAGDEIMVFFCIAGGTDGEVIRYMPVKATDRPFYRWLCEEDIDSPEGIGPADNLQQTQKALNEIFRLFIDNKKLAGNGMLAGKRRYMPNWSGEIDPGLFIDLSEECRSANDAIASVTIADVGGALLEAYNVLMGVAEDEGMLPRLAQGLSDQQGGTGSAATAYEISQRAERANKYSAQLIRNLDGILDPAMNWELQFLMMGSDLIRTKGPFIARATGYTSFQARSEQQQALRQMLDLALSSPDLTRLARLGEMARAMTELAGGDPDRFWLSEEETSDLDAQQPQSDPLTDAKAQEAMARAQKTAAEAEVQPIKTVAETRKIEAETEMILNPPAPEDPLAELAGVGAGSANGNGNGRKAGGETPWDGWKSGGGRRNGR